ncbi:hypothetical protein CAEBREN_09121 [Caenorhabditis brenneri]|uniref:Uncharacterized protein n=1 Tax=Caenorhabditis brenneri TaxID=135651 RepID=G0P511_CAEBE|nr:hypothetical protein CAEBREN_09121 [Caenorhabditis brenneri]
MMAIRENLQSPHSVRELFDLISESLEEHPIAEKSPPKETGHSPNIPKLIFIAPRLLQPFQAILITPATA